MERAQAERLYSKADAGRWHVPAETFTAALERSADKALAGQRPSAADVDRYYDSLHVSDLALACACEAGDAAAWDHFVVELRPSLFRAADALDPHGAARELAQELYADLYGLKEKDGVRQSLLRYYHGRSSLATWLRSLLAQRFVDRHRQTARLEALPDNDGPAVRAEAPRHDPDRARYVRAMKTALGVVLAALTPRDRLRLACYYAQEMTLAQIAALTREHEATVSRHLARTRKTVRNDVEARLHTDHGFSDTEVEECFQSLLNDAGELDLGVWLDTGRKKSELDRSKNEDPS